jgi:hypothetical protein
MIVYDFWNAETKQIEEVWLDSSSDLPMFKKNNPHLEYQITSLRVGDPLRLGNFNNKLPKDFRDGILGKAKKAHRHGTMQT